MKISLNWLKDYVDIDVSPEELAHEMTMLGLEIEAIERPGAEISNVFVGQILSIEPHPSADKLVVCRTDVGREEPEQIVCGAKNMKPGDKVPTAVVGASLPGGFKIDARKMRGVESRGMMCSGRELGLTDDQSGLLILPQELPIGQDVKPLLGLDDVIFEIEVIPNRGDWASMIGVARELAARFGKTLRIPEVNLTESAESAAGLASVTIDAPDLCPRYLGRVLKQVKVGPSPQWLAQRLTAAGQRPINNIVDITNYVLLETGHPLHAFDYELLAEHRIVVRRACAGEVAATLDGETRKLTPEMLVIADAQQPQAVAGVMGGACSEVSANTHTVLLESAVFDPISIRRASRALGLITESSQHFQRGADPEMAAYAINRAAALMAELAGAEVTAGVLDAHPRPAAAREVRLRFARCNQLLGDSVPSDKQVQFLERLGFVTAARDSESVSMRVPSWRHDVTLEPDLIEEVARLHNYGNIPTVLPLVRQTEAVLAPQETVLRNLRKFLVGQGLTEFYNWTFSCAEVLQKSGMEAKLAEMVPLDNPLSEKQSHMRGSLIPGLLASVAHNARHGVSSLAAFELGPVYHNAPDESVPAQSMRLGIALMGSSGVKHWSQPETASDFYELKGVVEAVFEFFGQTPDFQPANEGPFVAGQTACVASTTVLGKVKPAVLRAWDIVPSVFIAEIDLEPLLAQSKGYPAFTKIPAFPPVLRDLAVVVDRALSASELLETVRKAGGRNLASLSIFDIYTGKQIQNDKKSVALSLIFQSEEQTLTDETVQKSIDKIVKQLTATFSAELR